MLNRNDDTNKAHIALGIQLLEKAGIKPSELIMKCLNSAKDPLLMASAIATLPAKYHHKSTFLNELLKNEAYADRIARQIFSADIKKIRVTSSILPTISTAAKSLAKIQEEKVIKRNKKTTQEILEYEIYNEKTNEASIKSLILSGAVVHSNMINHLIKIKSYSLISFLLTTQPYLFTENHFKVILPQLLAEKKYALIALFLTQKPDLARLNFFQENLENLAFSYFQDTTILDSTFIALLYKVGFRLSTTKNNHDNVLAIAFVKKNIPHLNVLLSKEWIWHFSEEELTELLPKLLQEKMYDYFKTILILRNDLFDEYMKVNGKDGGLFLAILDEKPNQGHIKYFCEQGADPECENHSNQTALSICKEKRNYDSIKVFLSYSIKKMSTDGVKDAFETLITADIKNISLLENLIHHEATDIKEKKKIISELVSNAIERARTNEEIINIISVLEKVKNIDYFRTSQKVITVTQPIWKNEKVTEKWSLIIDEAKKKIIKLCQGAEKVYFNQQISDFLKSPVSSTQQMFSLNTEYAKEYQRLVDSFSLPALLKR
jgi:ankyrin repeat protein